METKKELQESATNDPELKKRPSESKSLHRRNLSQDEISPRISHRRFDQKEIE